MYRALNQYFNVFSNNHNIYSTWKQTSFIDCGVLSVPHGKVNTPFGTSTGAISTIKCDEGYILNGSYVVICTTSGWNDTSVACRIQGLSYLYSYSNLWALIYWQLCLKTYVFTPSLINSGKSFSHKFNFIWELWI